MKKHYLFPLLTLALLLTASLPRLVTTRPLVYRAVLALQEDPAPYEAVVYENELGATFSLSRADVGQYAVNASSAIFPDWQKVYLEYSLYNEGTDATNLCLAKLRRWDSDTVWITTFQQDPETGLFTFGDECSLTVEFVVYP